MLWKQEIRSYEIAKLKGGQGTMEVSPRKYDFDGQRLDTRMISLFGSISLIPVSVKLTCRLSFVDILSVLLSVTNPVRSLSCLSSRPCFREF